MLKPALVVIVFGVMVGLMWPSGPASRKVDAKVAAAQKQAAMARATDPALDTVLDRRDDGHFYVDAMVGETAINFVVDTGASVVALTQDDARAAGIAFDPSRFRVIARGASGDVRGQQVTIHRLSIGQKEAWDVDAVVVADGLDVSLLGQSYLGQIGSVSIANDKMTLR
jgi:aspartyl protease family protein